MDEDGLLNGDEGMMFEITDRERTQLELEKNNTQVLLNPDDFISEQLVISSEKYQSLFRYSEETIIEMDMNGVIVNVNDSIVRLIGLSPNELLQRHYNDFLVPGESEWVSEQFYKVLQGAPQSYEISLIHKNGKLLSVSVTNVPIIVRGEIVGAFGICKDVTENQRMERALRESEEHYRLLVEQCPIPIGMHSDHRIEFLNQAGLDIIGAKTMEQVKGSLWRISLCFPPTVFPHGS
ncbi:PAS domain S-box protein [Paenibacillus sp. TRM 82003]|nr:PAS domain S-box protein [Paenibacillus sp. TRM 82003]